MIPRGADIHALVASGPQERLISGGLKMVARVPGGAKGTWLKSCDLSKAWNADIFGLYLEVRRRLRVSCTWYTMRLYNVIEIFYHICMIWISCVFLRI